MNDKRLNKAEHSQHNICFKTEYGVHEIDNAVEAKGINAVYKKLSPAHIIDPIIVYWNIRRTVTIMQNQIFPVHMHKQQGQSQKQHSVNRVPFDNVKAPFQHSAYTSSDFQQQTEYQGF